MVGDHLSSVKLELDDKAQLISIEEVAPYGGTTFLATASHLNIPKRYRYSTKERDEETGLYYVGHRYFIPFLGRWLSPDPSGIADGFNVYCYVLCQPVGRVDRTGLNGGETGKEAAFSSSGSQASPFISSADNEFVEKKFEFASLSRFASTSVLGAIDKLGTSSGHQFDPPAQLGQMTKSYFRLETVSGFTVMTAHALLTHNAV